MSRNWFLRLIFISVWTVTSALPPKSVKRYRDYEYNRITDAFYKLHIEALRYTEAEQKCTLEGASVMIPSHEEDLTQLHGMLKRFPDIGNYVYVGNDGQQHTSAEETPIIELEDTALPDNRWSLRGCELVSRDLEIQSSSCYQPYPYVCKVLAKDAVYDERCGVYGIDYKYYEAVHSCYSVPKVPLSWAAAYTECREQGAHLAVLNSQLESQTVQRFLQSVTRVPNAQAHYFYFVGIRANQPKDPTERVWKTIFNQTLEEAGFAEWSEGEPNNHLNMEYCGTIFSNNGKYNDVDCSHLYGFICEKEVS